MRQVDVVSLIVIALGLAIAAGIPALFPVFQFQASFSKSCSALLLVRRSWALCIRT